MRVGLVSGNAFECTHIKLFNIAHLARLSELYERAESLGVPLSSPYGAIGSFKFVTTVIAVNAIAEGIINNHRTNAQEELLEEWSSHLRRIRKLGRWFQICDIKGIENPVPSEWIASYTFHDKDSGCEILTHWTHGGDEFIHMRTIDGECFVKWEMIEQYGLASYSR